MKNTAPSLMRRIAGMLYDFCVAIILALVISYIGIALLNTPVEAGSITAYFFFFTQLLTGLSYFIYYCVHKDNTAGMWVWKLRMLDSKSGNKPSPIQITIRYFSLLIIIASGLIIGSKALSLGVFGSFLMGLSTLGLSFLWMFKDSQQRLLHEALSNTHLIDISQK